MKVALVHDWLTGMRGGEKCLEEIVSFIGKTTLRESAALMHFCSILITNDSGLLHLAASINTSSISIFGPTAPWDKAPIGGKHKFLYKQLPCSPCYKYGEFSECSHITCLQSITPEEVFDKIRE